VHAPMMGTLGSANGSASMHRPAITTLSASCGKRLRRSTRVPVHFAYSDCGAAVSVIAAPPELLREMTIPANEVSARSYSHIAAPRRQQ
jgi:hypothetical protein